MKTQQSKNELWQSLQEQLDFLRRSSDSFDAGHWEEAKRLAVTVRVLVHNTETSKSLLTQLKLMPGMGFLCTARPQSPDILIGQNSRLVLISAESDGVRFNAPTDRIPPPPYQRHKIVFFPKWWNEPVVITDKAIFTRRNIVLDLSNKVGGAHVDPELDLAFAELLRGNPLGITASVNGETEQRVADIELHSMRQIAYEVLKSVERKLAAG
jgi:hypothetical protein